MPLTIPDKEPTDTIADASDQNPPWEESYKAVVLPEQTVVIPNIGSGSGFIVKVAVDLQPVPRV
jgi:hypothetical protein